MKIERGIFGVNTSNELIVICALGIYKMSSEYLLEHDFKSNDKLLGVIIDKVFHPCEEIKLNNGKKIFGFIRKNNLSLSIITYQIIENFDKQSFNPYHSKYNLGKEVRVFKNEIMHL
jgi:hypothetical protein